MNILLTGALGFIGSNLAIRLLNEGHRIIAFDNLINSLEQTPGIIKASVGDKWSNFRFYKIDIRQFESMHSICANENIQLIINLAAVGSVPKSFSQPAEYVDVNERGFVNIARLATHLAITRIIYASSSSVYGDTTDHIREEGKEGKCLSPYAISKKHNEMFSDIWAKETGIEFIGLRFFNVYGPGQSPFSAYSAVIPKFICDNTPLVNGDGTIIRDYTFIDDVCDAIINAMKIKLINSSEVFNVGTGKGTTLNKLLSILDKKADYGPGRKGDVACSIANTSKAENLLCFKAKTDIVKGLEIAKKFYEVMSGKT